MDDELKNIVRIGHLRHRSFSHHSAFSVSFANALIEGDRGWSRYFVPRLWKPLSESYWFQLFQSEKIRASNTVSLRLNRASVCFWTIGLSLLFWNKPASHLLLSRWWVTFTSVANETHLRAYRIYPTCWGTITCMQSRYSKQTMVFMYYQRWKDWNQLLPFRGS